MTKARLALALVALVATESLSGGCSSDSGRDAAASDALDDTATADVSPDAAADAGADAAPDAPGHDAASDAIEDDQICARKCELDAAIGCSADVAACVAQCRADMTSAVCYAETRAAFLCVLAIGQPALSCVNGRTFVKAGYCEDEQRVLLACRLDAARDAGPD